MTRSDQRPRESDRQSDQKVVSGGDAYCSRIAGRADARRTPIASASLVRITQFIRRVPEAYRLRVGTVTRRWAANFVSSTTASASRKMTWAIVGAPGPSWGAASGTLEVEMGVNTVANYGTG